MSVKSLDKALDGAQQRGWTYNLRYAPEQDRLVGDYFQAVQRQTFDVEFVRQE